MKHFETLYICLLFAIGISANAQTLKNIHRNNLPVLQIPIDLIDKVETVDLAGQKYLNVTQFNGFVNEVLVSQIDSITHSEGEALDPAQLGNLRTASVMGIVRGPNGAPEMNAIVRSPYGGEETHTDPNGVFFLNNIVVYDKLGYITITKPGFHQGSRSFLPLETGSNRVNIQLLPMTQSGSFSASTGGTVTSGLLQLNFPANSIVQNGQPYAGTVRVFAQALDPSSTEMFDQMPGELLGGMNDSLRLLRSFGMASIELRDANMNELQLAEGSSATLTFNIPPALQVDAPETIDWWSFEETLGYWKHEGEAQKQGNTYVGQANHFSWWNCDVPENFNDFHGSVNTADGTPISDALVNVVTPTMGTGVTYTNAEGAFSGRVPKNQLLTLNIFLTCVTTNDWALAYTEDFSSAAEPIIGQYEPASLDGRYPISGTVVNCIGQPVEFGYVKMGPQLYIVNQGEITIQTCSTGNYTLRGYDTSTPDSVKASEILSVQVDINGAQIGNIQACHTLYGTVVDIEGNVYTTIEIGSQVWIAENLRTTRFSDGSEIPNNASDSTWIQLSSPAWCSYSNSFANEVIYGKLYKWYTVSDPRNVCPTGWHIPSDDEWVILSDNLGGSLVAGGKMKIPSGWTSPNLGASNLSGFTAIPSGIRGAQTAGFTDLGNWAGWWSANEQSANEGRFLYVHYSTSESYNGNFSKRCGLAIRCLKD